MNLLKFSLFFSTCLFFTGCFSTYPIQKKTPCEETTTDQKISMIEEAYFSEMLPKDLVVTDKGVSYKRHSYDYEDIKFVRVQTKPSFLYLYKKYWIQIREFNGEMNVIYSKNHDVVEKANNALMCLCNLQETNGRPKKHTIEKPTTDKDKYDKIEQLKKLLDDGAITQEEYETEKGKLLNE